MKKEVLIFCTLMISSSLLIAEGQDSFTIIFGAIDFMIIFCIWAMVVFGGLFITNRIGKKKINKKQKRLIVILSAIIALFIWSMIIHDSRPFEGPIDSIFYNSNGEKRF